MIITVIVIIVLILVVKFFIDRDKMLQKQVDTHGGMRQKYSFLIQELSQEAKPEFCDIKRDYIYFRIISPAYQSSINYYITEQFDSVIVEWVLQMGTMGKLNRKWSFKEGTSQEKMINTISSGIQKEMEKISLW